MTLARLLLPVLLSLSAVPGFAQSGPPPGGSAPKGPTKVGVMMLEKAKVPRRSVLPGRAIASQEARIRPRVTGMVTEILYTPGQRLEAGTPMFRLDDSTLQAEVESARATVARATAALTLAEAAATRAKALEGSGSTRVTVETAEAEAAQARAELSSAEAALKLAEQDLGWAEIRSPITGIAGFATVSVGDLVTAGQSDPLATVTTLDPIWVDLYEPAARLLSIREQIKAGALTPQERLDVTLTLENGQSHQGEGHLVAPSIAVSTTTGTQDFRFSFANPDGLIRPGMFLRGAVVVGQMEAIRVPQRAATIGRGGVLSVFLAEDGRAVKAQVTPAGNDGNDWLVSEGLEPGAALIVDGLTNLRDGAEVETVPVSIDAQGVVRDAVAPPPAAPSPPAAGN